MTKQQIDFHQFLLDKFLAKRKRNPSYSLRAYARDLDLPPGRLSEIINKKRLPTSKMINKIADNLLLSPNAKAAFIANNKSKESKTSTRYRYVSEDEFRTVSEWYHFAIFNLISTRNFESDPRWISGRLGISTVEVQNAVQRLERLGLIQMKETGWSRTNTSITTSHDLISSALKKAHLQILEMAALSLNSTPIEKRDMTSISMPISLSDMKAAKEMIKKFRRQFCQKFETELGDEVYTLNIQFFPLSK